LHSHGNDAAVARETCRALATLTWQHSGNQVAVAALGLIPLFVTWLGSPSATSDDGASADQDVLSSALDVLANLAANDFELACDVAQQCTDMIIAIMNRQRSSSRVQAAACSVLSHLARHGGTAYECLVASSATDAISLALCLHASSELVQSNGRSALSALSQAVAASERIQLQPESHVAAPAIAAADCTPSSADDVGDQPPPSSVFDNSAAPPVAPLSSLEIKLCAPGSRTGAFTMAAQLQPVSAVLFDFWVSNEMSVQARDQGSTLLCKIAEAILKSPSEQKYRKIKRTIAREKLSGVQCGLEVLRAIGFQERDDWFVFEGTLLALELLISTIATFRQQPQ
jgi:hypothetical protein